MSFEEIFGSGKQAKPTPNFTHGGQVDQGFLEDIASRSFCASARSPLRRGPEGVAFINTVNAFLDATESGRTLDQNKCAHCGSSERPNELRPMGGGARHSWVHNGCWPDWFARRRADAIAELAAMGIVSP